MTGDVRHRAEFAGRRPHSSTGSGRVFPDALGAKIRSTPKHGAWTAGSCSRGNEPGASEVERRPALEDETIGQNPIPGIHAPIHAAASGSLFTTGTNTVDPGRWRFFDLMSRPVPVTASALPGFTFFSFQPDSE